MLEGLAAWVLNSYLGQYVENLNTDQLSVGLLKGDVELEGLPLKREALAAFDLPIEVKSGFIGKIRLHIPLTCLRSEPWTISIEQLYLVAGPIPPDDYDEEREDQAKQDRKLSKLDRMEAKWRTDQEAKQEASYYASSYTSWMSYGTSVVSSILENVQIKIKDVHIRFEDEFTNRECPLTWGIMLESLEAQSSNEQWVPQFMSSSDGIKFKLVQLQRLSVYWDVAHDVALIGHLEFTEMAEAMKLMSSSTHRHNYIVEPVSFEARFKRNTCSCPLQSRTSPRFACDFLLDKLPISLNEDQYESMAIWMYEFDRLGRTRHFHRWRPKVPVHNHVREWWQFAAKPQMSEYRWRYRGRNWPFILRRAKNNVEYVKAYMEHLINPVTCPAAFKNHKDAMEQEVPFEELKLLREIAMERVLAVEEETRLKEEESNNRINAGGILHRWFPLWAGWYPSNNQTNLVKAEAQSSRRQLEVDILDVLNDIEDERVFKKDAIFATVNFVLKCGTFTLFSSSNSGNQSINIESTRELFELAFADVQFLMELKPRSASSLYQLCLGTLHLRDKSMEKSLFPVLVEPQIRENVKPLFLPRETLASKYLPKFPWSNDRSSGTATEKPIEEPLLKVTYETKPQRSTSDFRLHVKSRSLDIVYNEASFKRLIGFFTSPYQQPNLSGRNLQDHVEQPLASVAKNRYEQLKRETQKEIRKNWDQILDGEQKFTQRWDIDLDISAPQIILPESFFAEDTTMVVFDFGRFQFRTSSSKIRFELKTPESDDDDEDFKTPFSTPPNEKDDDVSLYKPTILQTMPTINENLSHCDITDDALHQRMYDSYSLDLRDLRVLVYKAKSDWKRAYHQATSTMHVVDRFSVSLLLERRVIHTVDPQWPSATISGSLPKLAVHMNEQKLQALKMWYNVLSTSTTSWTQCGSPVLELNSTQSSFYKQTTDSDLSPKETQPESRLLVIQFSVGQMCIDLQSRGQSVAELQVTGIKSTFTMRPYDTAVSLTVHGLLLVDALQTFGSDFELLVASHRNICIDSVSGSLRDSEANSPTSPSSPSISSSYAQFGTSPTSINTALKHLQTFDRRKSSPTLKTWTFSSITENPELEALISIHFVMLHPSKILASMGPTNVATVHFNNLDIIANQRTIVELLGFFRQAFPEGFNDGSEMKNKFSTMENESKIDKESSYNMSLVRLELTFDFHRLSVLFLKTISCGEVAVAHKVATVTMTGASIQAKIGSTLEVNGSLGSLQVFDLLPEGAKHSRILSVGRDYLFDKQWITLVDRLQADIYKNFQGYCPSTQDTLEKAFVFKVTTTHVDLIPEEETVSLVVRMASVRYVHSMRFLIDLSLCASEFKQYMADFASSVKSAAAEVAELCLKVDVKLDILVDSPIIVIPETQLSDNVLIAHLGRITISKSTENDERIDKLDKFERMISIEVKDISLFSQSIDGNPLSSSSAYQQWINKSQMPVEDENFKGFPILHKTVVVLTVDRLKTGSNSSTTMINESTLFTFDEAPSNEMDNFFKVSGRVVSPLKVSLSKKQYEQILKTLDSTTNVYVKTETDSNYLLTSPTSDESTFDQNVQTQTASYYYSLKAKFELPKLTVILFGDLVEMERPLVSLSFQDFLVNYDKRDQLKYDVTITLRTLIMEDLLEDLDSKHRFLMLSSAPENKMSMVAKARYLSSSCPDVSFNQLENDLSRLSLPDRLNTENVFQNLHRIREKRLFGGCIHKRQQSIQSEYVVRYPNQCPRTPPPSPLGVRKETISDSDFNALVTVKIHNVETIVAGGDNVTNRYIDVNFNCLNTIINLHSWVVVLDFFGIGESSPTISSTINEEEILKTSSSTVVDDTCKANSDTNMTTEMEIRVRSLTMIFNKEEYELAKAKISEFDACVLQTKDYVSIKGKLGNMSLMDLTPNGHLYSEKFTTVGNEALDFEIFKFYNKNLLDKNSYDAKVKLNMSSVHYVHTNRFSTEICAFFLHFHQLQNLMAQFRADATGIVNSRENGGPSARVKLDIRVGSPVIVVPISSHSSSALVIDLGRMSLNNEFSVIGSRGTISVVNNQHLESEMEINIPDVMTRAVYGSLDCGGPCVLDVIRIHLMDMDLCLAERLERDSFKQKGDFEFTPFVLIKKSGSLLTAKCKLNLQMERNLHYTFDHSVADVSVHGTLSTVHCMLDLNQYKVVRGILSYNLGEALEEFNFPEIESKSTNVINNHRSSIPIATNNWTQLSLHFDLVNVIVEIYERHASPPHQSAKPLAKVNLFKSKLTYERYANNSVDVDLVSQEILVSDIRFRDMPVNAIERTNVFTNILEPTKGSESDFLQVEIHFRLTKELTRATVLLNNMRVIAVLDWWISILEFVCADMNDCKQGDDFGTCNSIWKGPFVSTKQSMTTVSDGVITKRGPTSISSCVDNNSNADGVGTDLSFELKINVTETGIVIVEDPSSFDTDAVILKATAVVSHRPGVSDKPLSCSLQRLEIFSCLLGLEEDTALSIVDPVTVTVELLRKHSPDSGRGLLDSMDIHNTIEISVQDLNVRLSYHDLQLFLRLLNSLPKQFFNDSDGDDKTAKIDVLNVENVKRLGSRIAQLQVLGFKQSDCLKALEACGDKLDDAALWLTLHATPISTKVHESDFDEMNSFKLVKNIKAIDFHINHFCLCLIDDCRDADVPLVEVTLYDLGFHQSLGDCRRSTKGRSQFLVQGDFYNRNLSGWEPFLEPWKCDVDWCHVPSVSDSESVALCVKIRGHDVLDINVTSTLIDLYRSVKANWTEDYYRSDRENDGRHRRSPFVPFALKNDTGCKLKFATITSNHEQLTNIVDFIDGGQLSRQITSSWIDVDVGDKMPFSFGGRPRTRHRDTHDFKVHQLIVFVDGWQQLAPVSVDKVGVFFRYANPATSSRMALPARIVFAVTLKGSAQKLVTVRSALTLINQLDAIIELKLENSAFRLGAIANVKIQPGKMYPIPLTFVWAHLFIRPIKDPPLLYCNNAIQWQQVVQSNDVQESIYCCTSTSTRPNACHFRFCARVRRDNYPSAFISNNTSTIYNPQLIGHQITLISPVVLINLLPYDLTYEVRNYPDIRGCIKAGRDANLNLVDLSKTFYLALFFDNFRVVNDLVVPNGSTGFVAVLQARDISDRILLLQVRATGHSIGSSIRIAISAPYWLVNKTGLPLIIRQEGVGGGGAAAGQFSEHEMARSVAPLLFSFSDVEAPALCSMRLGRSVHAARGGEPQWSHHFHLETGVRVRRLHVIASDSSGINRPDWVYGIGIDVRRGRGRHIDVHIVTFTPRFQLDNCSSSSLELAQKYALEIGVDHELNDVRVSAMPSCVLPFHWPRPDREQLLCVRIGGSNRCWSGGFPIERVDSFHVNMRDEHGVPTFLRVQVVLQGATYVVVFTDADRATPSPLRLDNLSEVPVTCYQSAVENVERLRLCLRPHTSVPYAWDEPTLPPSVTCLAPGGCGAIYSLASLGESETHLSYENFIYIAFMETFEGSGSGGGGGNGASNGSRYRSDSDDTRELVLDVPHGTNRLVLARKEPGRRSQLWRMTSSGMLQHEGSSPPTRGGHLRRSLMITSQNHRSLVLDIEDMAPRPREYVRLLLRKPDNRRALTQTWEFTGDGRLCCRLTSNSLFVQPRDGFHGLRSGSEVVIGPAQPVQYMLTKTGIPVEQVVGRQRLWSGSGLLGIKIITQGPTRVLQIMDIKHKSQNTNDLSPINRIQLQVVLSLPSGVGLSLINHSPVPEELLYVRFNNILIEITRSSTNEEKLDGSVQSIQMDNQLPDPVCPVLLFVSPPNQGGRRDEEMAAADRQPAIHFTVHRVRPTGVNNSNIELFKNLIMNVKNLTLQVEERLLWKLCQFCGVYCGDGELDEVSGAGFSDNVQWLSAELAQAAASIALAKRYYFDVLRLKLDQVRLSVITSSGLLEELKAIKRRTGLLTLVRFEDALVELDPFIRTHVFQTGQFIVDSILQHYRDELKGQAAKILGAVDFLGNPLGLVNDVSEGLSGFLIEGNVGGLLKNVTHGLSNSAAKVTGTLSDGLGSVTMDARHREQRRRLQQSTAEGGSERLVAGLKGLGFGLYGGMTSLVVQTYEGAANDGVTGIFTGFGKGLIGTFTKPAVGMLDLATSAASAVRDTSRSSHHQVPSRIRMRRVCVGPAGLLTQYSLEKSRGQELLYSLNDKDYGEVFIGCEPLGYTRDALYALISSRKVYFLSQGSQSMSTAMSGGGSPINTTECILIIPLSDLYHCKVVREASRSSCLELTTRATGTSSTTLTTNQTTICNRPKVVCDTEAIALKVARQINYAKRMSDELLHTLISN